MSKEKHWEFQKGNKLWQNRSSFGEKKIFKTDKDLWNACVEYFEWNDNNPLQEEKINFYQGEPSKATVNKMGALTMEGLYSFLMICRQTWTNYKSRDEYVAITTRVENIIRDQKFRGAAADLLNPNIIARDLGLIDKVKQELTVKEKPAKELTEQELDAYIAKHT